MDWGTLTRQQVEHDALPRVCMVCGGPATCTVSRDFDHTPDWVGWLFLAGFFPGVIAAHFYTKKMRVPCAFCANHRGHWRTVGWVGGLGWLLGPVLFGGLGYLIVALITSWTSVAAWIVLGVAAGVGLVTWLSILIYLCNTRVHATKVTDDDITLQGVCDAFAKAARDQQGSLVQ